jgi:hypothetical protein
VFIPRFGGDRQSVLGHQLLTLAWFEISAQKPTPFFASSVAYPREAFLRQPVVAIGASQRGASFHGHGKLRRLLVVSLLISQI